PSTLPHPRHHPAPPSFPTRRSSDLPHSRPPGRARIPALLPLHSGSVVLRRSIPLFAIFPYPLDILPRTFAEGGGGFTMAPRHDADRKSTRLNSSHQIISYAVFCLKK